ncbi:Putative aminoacrylate hydrolase RutD [Methylobacterium crusticola]|uniref:Aminoacrylate hydrolase RutD n=1 Tax=Methylobacterium crusticola TaxID=1697972 RepID=A0ABQ4R0U5_9HYPH|nr:alpha/beta hydrolase [Methylobacterium crusticola]GJD51300.1 Putative aminoacrylate hydrolase RutD [Methylobacterium crusticola]
MTVAKCRAESEFTTHDGVRLAHVEAGPRTSELPPLVLVNGWTGDHGIFTPQIAYFSPERRVVAVDLRGHGASDAPEQEYTMAGFADDVAWQCRAIGLEKPVVIGHSLGGAVALELCGRYPGLAAGLVMIDSMVMAPPAMRDHPDARRLLEGIGGPGYLAVSQANAWAIGCDFDDPQRRREIFENYILGPCLRTPQHVAYSAIGNFILDHDPVPAAAACRIPMAYISADVPAIETGRDLERLRRFCPQLVTAKTLLAGHFNTIEVAEQVNAMIERFLAVGLRRRTMRPEHCWTS